jgi:hypothetical protein
MRGDHRNFRQAAFCNSRRLAHSILGVSESQSNDNNWMSLVPEILVTGIACEFLPRRRR